MFHLHFSKQNSKIITGVKPETESRTKVEMGVNAADALFSILGEDEKFSRN